MLKQGIADPLLLETVDTFLCQAAAAIHKARQQWIERFTPIFMRYYNTISDSNEQVRLDYRSVLNTQTMAEVLRQNLERDRVLGHTSMGVHRDDIELMLGDELIAPHGLAGTVQDLHNRAAPRPVRLSENGMRTDSNPAA